MKQGIIYTEMDPHKRHNNQLERERETAHDECTVADLDGVQAEWLNASD